RFLVITPAVTHFADNIHVRKKIHLNAPLAFTLAGFTSPAGYIERKPSRLVSAFARFRQHRVQIAYMREHLGVSRRIGSWSSADRRLINTNDFIDVLSARDRFVLARFFA